MTFEEFIAQHDGLSLIKESYNLTDEEMKQAFMDGLNSLLQLKSIANNLKEN